MPSVQMSNGQGGWNHYQLVPVGVSTPAPAGASMAMFAPQAMAPAADPSTRGYKMFDYEKDKARKEKLVRLFHHYRRYMLTLALEEG